jgi:thiamine phosphate synthase YjbQ (UPF0047 family)
MSTITPDQDGCSHATKAKETTDSHHKRRTIRKDLYLPMISWRLVGLESEHIGF